jgi:hypothetical protein
MVYIHRVQELFLSMPATNRTRDRMILARCWWGHRSAAVLTLVGVLSSACVNSSRGIESTREYLDPLTGVTITSLPEPLIMAHAEPRISNSLRDYLYVGPVEVNRMGKRSYYLWIDTFSTLDRPPIIFNRITLKAGGTTAELKVPDNANHAAEIQTPPYTRPLAKTPGYYIPVSAELLTDIARAESIVIETHSDTLTLDYNLWHSDLATLRQFANGLARTRAAN